MDVKNQIKQNKKHPYDADTEDNFRLNQPVKRLKSRRQYREKLSLKERQLDLAENSVKTVVPFTQSHCSEAEHSGDDHCSEAEQQPLCCSPSEHDILDRCSGSEQGFSSNNDKLNYEKCETVFPFFWPGEYDSDICSARARTHHSCDH